MEYGLTSKSANEKLKIFGKNEITIPKKYSTFSLFLSQFPNFINGILAAAAILSFVVKNTVDAVFILAILILNALFGFIQEYRAERSLEKLKEFIKPVSRVIRDGKEMEMPTADLVPGDIVVLSEGDRIPADGKLTHGKHIEIDESILTGESIPVLKKQNDIVFSGTLVTRGKARLLVEKTGMNSRFGQIAQTLSDIEQDKTPLKRELNTLGKVLSIIVIVISFMLIPIGMSQGKSLLPLIVLAISIGIAAIPEGLLPAITIALAMGTARMAKKNAIVRKMPAVETLGAIQIILTDKTGTLTQNSMRVKKFWVKNQDSLPLLFKASFLGNTASLVQKVTDNASSWDIIGDKTDGALLLWLKTQVKNLDELKNSGKIVDEYSFDPDTKTITTVWNDLSKTWVFVRGAPEEILSKSNLDAGEKQKIKTLFESYAKEGLRVIGFGAKKHQSTDKTRDLLEKDLDFLGFVGLYDPPRPEARLAVERARQAGIQTIMVTGDNELTALAIGKEIGFIQKDEEVITGEELEKITDAELERLIVKTRIFARAKPEDKLRLVNVLKKLGYIVGVTGDGVNDALALKRADVGIAMGDTGTDVAKEASDIVLTDDNFSTIVGAVEEGRRIYDNIRKAITYLLSGNLSEISLVFFASLLGMPIPLLPTQILWINLVTDGLPALALASDRTNTNLLKNKPRDPNAPLLEKNQFLFILIVGFSLSFFLIGLFHILLGSFTQKYSQTIIFNILIFSHLLLAFVIRGKSFFRKNPLLIFSTIATIVMQIAITTVPFLQNIFHVGL